MCELGIKLDVLPSKLNQLHTVRSISVGSVKGYCFELCGSGHSYMQMRGIVLEANDENDNKSNNGMVTRITGNQSLTFMNLYFPSGISVFAELAIIGNLY